MPRQYRYANEKLLGMAFYAEADPKHGELYAIAPGISRLVANNPSKMTYDTADGVYVVDPGPAEDEVHLNTILHATENRPPGIIVSHHHSDHFGLVPRLKAATGLKVFASSVFADVTFRPDVDLDNGDDWSGLTVMHTPGHASDHLCFSFPGGVVLTGDHIMTWSSSMGCSPMAICWHIVSNWPGFWSATTRFTCLDMALLLQAPVPTHVGCLITETDATDRFCKAYPQVPQRQSNCLAPSTQKGCSPRVGCSEKC